MKKPASIRVRRFMRNWARSSSGTTDWRASRPWRKALGEARALPSGVRGPVERMAFRRLVWGCLSDGITTPLNSRGACGDRAEALENAMLLRGWEIDCGIRRDAKRGRRREPDRRAGGQLLWLGIIQRESRVPWPGVAPGSGHCASEICCRVDGGVSLIGIGFGLRMHGPARPGIRQLMRRRAEGGGQYRRTSYSTNSPAKATTAKSSFRIRLCRAHRVILK